MSVVLVGVMDAFDELASSCFEKIKAHLYHILYKYRRQNYAIINELQSIHVVRYFCYLIMMLLL